MVMERVDEALSAGDDPAARVELQEFGTIVAKHVSNLPPRQREVLVLIAFEQLNVSEAANVLNVTEQNVRTNLHLARERMREKLAKYMSEKIS
jgi:RNA polymerase sigma-70 factor (ECF subfamily)